MERLALDVRIRPQRVAVVIRAGAELALLERAVAFLSGLWGGRYCALIAIEDSAPDVAMRQLRLHNSDVIATLEETGPASVTNLTDAFSPRAWIHLSSKWREEIKRTGLGLVSSYAAAALLAERVPAPENSLVRLVRSADPRFQILYCVTFGSYEADSEEGLVDALGAHVAHFQDHSDADYLRLCRDMKRLWSWLDVGSGGLDRVVTKGDFMSSPPTIVILEDMVPDLALYWSLRMQTDHPGLRGFLPFPANAINNPAAIEALVQWISENHVNANHLRLTSSRGPSTTTKRVEAALRKPIGKFGIKFIDFHNPLSIWPVIAPVSETAYIDASIEDRIVTFRCPQPHFAGFTRRHDAWIADVTATSGRSIADLCLPESKAMEQVLLAPTPPSLGGDQAPPVRQGIDCLSFRCMRSAREIRWTIPSAEELIHAHLREFGLEPRRDEKRLRYEAAFSICGGFISAANLFSGRSGRVINALWKGPQLRNQLMPAIGSAGGRLEILSVVEKFADKLPSHARRVMLERHAHAAEHHLYPEDDLNAFLTKWVRRRIVQHKWNLPPCSKCLDRSWVDRIDIRRPVACPGCGCERVLPQEIALGYELNPMLKKAMDEGIVPVVLAGRVIAWMKRRGFFWLAGQKICVDDRQHDIDFLGCCDGHLVVGECKTAPKSAETWRKARKQFMDTVEMARRIHATIVMFACMAPKIHNAFTNGLTRDIGSDLGVLLLAGPDLEGGYIHRPDGEGVLRRCSIDDFMPKPVRKRRTKRAPRTRTL